MDIQNDNLYMDAYQEYLMLKLFKKIRIMFCVIFMWLMMVILLPQSCTNVSITSIPCSGILLYSFIKYIDNSGSRLAKIYFNLIHKITQNDYFSNNIKKIMANKFTV